MTNDLSTDVIVIGAGITGLATAHFLERKGVSTRVLEKETRVGGTIRTDHMDGFMVENGPNNALDVSPVLHELFESAGLEATLEYANDKSQNRYIVRGGKLINLPMSPLAFLKTPLFSVSAKLRLLKEPFIAASDPTIDESLADFVRRRIGDEFLDYAINPFVAGVYAGDPDSLSVRSGFPKLLEIEQKYGSLIKGTIMGAKERKKQKETSKQNARLFSFSSGMQTMTDALAAARAETIHTGIHIESIEKDNDGFAVTVRLNGGSKRFKAGKIIMAVPAHAYGELNFMFDFPLRGQLERIYYPPVAEVFFGYRSNPSPTPLDGFGFLVPKKENRQILGTIWSSTLFPGRAPAGGVALTTFVGGSRQPENALLDDGRLADIVRNDIRDLMGIDTAPDTVTVARWDKAIPQYRVGHQTIIDAIERFEQDCPGLYVTGNFRGGISVADCITGAKTMSERVASDISNKTLETNTG